MFIGREKELETLNRLYKTDNNVILVWESIEPSETGVFVCIYDERSKGESHKIISWYWNGEWEVVVRNKEHDKKFIYLPQHSLNASPKSQ